MKKICFSLVAVTILAVSGCKSSSTSTDSYVKYDTECLGVELDGSQTVRAWGQGRNKSDAKEQARKNAVYDVVFKGISSGSGECNIKPLVFDVNAHEKYEEYFNKFFRDNGDYKKYVSDKDAPGGSKMLQSNASGQKYGIVVRVKRSELQERLKSDGIVK